MHTVARTQLKEYCGRTFRDFVVEFDHLNGHGLVERRTVGLAEARALLRLPLRPECQPALEVGPEDLEALFE